MSRKLKITIAIVLFFILMAAFFLLAKHNASKPYQRSISTLFDQYYRLKDTNPAAAKLSLEYILNQEPTNKLALSELKKFQHKDEKLALRLNLQFTDSASNSTRIGLNERTNIPLPIENIVNNPSAAILTLPLFAQYYQIKTKNPIQAAAILQEILLLNPNASLAYTELGYLALNAGETKKAIIYFEGSYALEPNAQIAAQLGYLMIDMKQLNKAEYYFEQSIILNDGTPNPQILLIQSQLQALLNPAKKPVKLSQSSPFSYDNLMNKYYQLKKENPALAQVLLLQVLAHYPTDILALKEAGYNYLAQKNYTTALSYFLQAYQLNKDPTLAMQIAYIYNIEGQNAAAYRYFVTVTKSQSSDLVAKAQNALDNLSGLQTKILPSPFFIDIYYAPFYYSRFLLFDNPLIIRGGVTLEEKHKVELYVSFRYTKDNRSSAGPIPQIYDSNQGIIALGISAQPFVKIPMIVFAEAGKAYSLINVEPTVLNDVRGGEAFYTQWGKPPSYAPTTVLPMDWTGTLYNSIIYYSQYDNDVIADTRIREGLRVLQSRVSTIDVYLTGHLVLDTNQEFYNNIFEWGPGIAFTPSTRYNIVLRIEDLKGYYIPVNSPTPNPYGSQYHNNVIQLVTFMRI